jgi:hypothetical protein
MSDMDRSFGLNLVRDSVDPIRNPDLDPERAKICLKKQIIELMSCRATVETSVEDL